MAPVVFVGVHKLDWTQEDREYVAVTIFGIRYVVWEDWDQGTPTGKWGWNWLGLKGEERKWSKAIMCKSPETCFRQAEQHFAKTVEKVLKLKRRD